MLVSAGEANNTDLNDLWAMNLDTKFWYKLDLDSQGHDQKFVSKRFHTVSSLSKSRVVSFGGCHSEYVHLNDVNVFDLNTFVTSDGADCHVTCSKLDMRGMGPIPSSRWGHAATVSNDKLFILGGRNNEDINDLYCFDIHNKRWTKIDIGHPMPKPRRRHSAIFVASTIVMFGGFDGDFFNDMHLMHFTREQLKGEFGRL